MALPIGQSHSAEVGMSHSVRSRLEDTALEREPADAPVTRVLGAGLSNVERRMWWRLLDLGSIAAVARKDGVSRSTVYRRIRGRTRRPSGMVCKNRWVFLWWEARLTFCRGRHLRSTKRPSLTHHDAPLHTL